MTAPLDPNDEADVAALAAALHAEFWDDTMEHASEGERACVEMERGSAARILAALPASPAPLIDREHQPGEPHDYRIACKVCGQRGTVRLSIEPQSAESEP